MPKGGSWLNLVAFPNGDISRFHCNEYELNSRGITPMASAMGNR